MRIIRKLFLFWLLTLPIAALAAPLVDINTADSESLVDGLVGVGPQKAMAIIRHRQANGPFKQVDDLALVKGISDKTVEKNRANMTVTLPKAARK